MTVLKAYLNSRKVQKVLSTRPGEEGFSLIELVVVIAVLAILAAVAIPAFNGIQNDARASAAKSGMANGIKECLVLQARGREASDGGLDFDQAKAFAGEYRGYNITAWSNSNTISGCFGVKAFPKTGYTTTLPKLFMSIDGNGEITKSCGQATFNTKAKWEGVTGEEYCW